MPIFARENARLSYPVTLDANFYTGGVLFDPVIDRVEIWKNAEKTTDGGVLVDVITNPLQIVRLSIGQYQVVWDAFLEGSPLANSPLMNPGHQGPGSPLQDPTNPAAITANTRYFDKWFFRPTSVPVVGDLSSLGLSFYLYPDTYFVDSKGKYRYEVKQDRKIIVQNENLDVRLRIIPIPLYRDLRDPIVDYLLPISKMDARLLDDQNNEKVAWGQIAFTGKEGIYPTAGLAALSRGQYLLQVKLTLPNGQVIMFRKLVLQLED